MRIYSATTITGAVLTTLLAFSAFARDHSALNGAWTPVPAKSDFAGQPIVQTGTVTITNREGIIIVSRSFVYEGTAETFFYSDITDSECNATIHTGKDLKSKTKWDHDVLKVTTTQSEAITVESYALAKDGTMTVTSKGRSASRSSSSSSANKADWGAQHGDGRQPSNWQVTCHQKAYETRR
jgi:hypothetical protein